MWSRTLRHVLLDGPRYWRGPSFFVLMPTPCAFGLEAEVRLRGADRAAPCIRTSS